MPTRVNPTKKRKAFRKPPPTAAAVSGALRDLSPWLRRVSRASVQDVGFFGIALRAAVAKSVEFATFVHVQPPRPSGFFLTATLRGICEDLIVLTFLERLSSEDRDAAVRLLMLDGAREGMAAQGEFFRAERPWQPVLRPSAELATDTEGKLRALSSKLGWTGRQGWPSVWFMAKAASLAPLYGYLYSATSKWVHFSPHLLLRMGWGGASGNSDHRTKWHFTTENFSHCYTEFNQVYSVYLLVRLVRGPATPLQTKKASAVAALLERALSETLRWPEVVTFEEMNLKGPHPLQRLLLKVAHEIDPGADGDPAL